MMSRCIQLILVLALGRAIAVSAAPQVTVTVKPTSGVSEASVTLGDIATIQGAEAKQADRFKAVSVCTSPLPGRARKVTDDQVITAMKRAGLYGGSVAVLCPSEVSVTRTSAFVGSTDLIETVRKHVLSTNTWAGTVSVEPALSIADQTVPTGTLGLRVRAGTRGARKGRNSVPVEIVVNDKIYRTVQVSVNVKLVAPVAVSTKAIARSEEISAGNVVIQERDVTMLPDDILTSMPEPSWTANMPIPEGSILRRSWVAAPPAIHSGDQVLVVVSNGPVTVTDKGTAAQDGCVGDKIKVRLNGEGREIRGTVAGQGLIQITISGRK